jgi:RNA recognition motif-containing protein
MSVQFQQFCSAALQDPMLRALFNGDLSIDDITQVDKMLRPAHPNPKGIKTLLARNLPRDVQLQELRLIFEAYGPVRDIHIPKNSDTTSPYYGTIKGFAMITFLDADSSTNAYLGLKSTLVLRNRLVAIEMANENRQPSKK